MVFTQKRSSDIHNNRKNSSYLLSSLMILAGAAVAAFLTESDGFLFVSDANLGCKFACGCLVVVILIPILGINPIGSLLICAADAVFGMIAVFLVCNRLSDTDIFSCVWFFWAALIFALDLCVLILSSKSCEFSSLIFSRLKADSKFGPKLFRFLCFSLGVVLLIASVLIVSFRINPELFI